jgi:hypothetical protein
VVDVVVDDRDIRRILRHQRLFLTF